MPMAVQSPLGMTPYAVDAESPYTGAIRLRFIDRVVKDHVLTWREVFGLWRRDVSFCELFSASLAATPFEAFFWETPPITLQGLDLPFECIVISAPALARQQGDSTPFATQFGAERGHDVVIFRNLGGDAELVVPSDARTGANYAHLAVFLRTASPAQTQAIWRAVVETAEARLALGKRLWISTAGLGVSWVHVRLDSRPKYYTHTPYRVCL
jgi:hypothetical protein